MTGRRSRAWGTAQTDGLLSRVLAHPLPTCSPSRPVILNFPHKETRPVLGLLITPAMPFLMRDYLLVAANKLVGFIKMDAVDKGSPAFLVLSN